MLLGVPKESHPGERRVAATPDSVARLVEHHPGLAVVVESGAGVGAKFSDEDYVEAGATIGDPWAADVVIKVRAPRPVGDDHEVDRLRQGAVLICMLFPAQNEALVARLAEAQVATIALDKIPRISRAQKMDVLSSMANIAGYRAIIEAATVYGKFFAGQITAAGRSAPARVLVIGAGVAGLAAIAAARGLGAEVRAFDVRPAVKEQVESLGASFLELQFEEEGGGETAGGYAKVMSDEFIAAEMALFLEQAKEVDVIVTTALIPGRPAPKLITHEMVGAMKPGSVVVDLAAEQGGNCEATVPGEAVDVGGVTIIGFTDLTSRLPTHASNMFASNVVHLLDEMGGDSLVIDHDSPVVRPALCTHEGEVTWPPPEQPPVTAAPKPEAAQPDAPTETAPRPEARPPERPEPRKTRETGGTANVVLLLAGLAGLGIGGAFAPQSLVQHMTVFVLACFVGWYVIWKVTPALHTPLMSVTNAISGIIIVGGMLQAGTTDYDAAAILGAIAILVASINIAGGFLVTHRMLQMFRREEG